MRTFIKGLLLALALPFIAAGFLGAFTFGCAAAGWQLWSDFDRWLA